MARASWSTRATLGASRPFGREVGPAPSGHANRSRTEGVPLVVDSLPGRLLIAQDARIRGHRKGLPVWIPRLDRLPTLELHPCSLVSEASGASETLAFCGEFL